MKGKLFMQAIIISFLFLALVGVLAYWDIRSCNKRIDDLNNTTPRRYVDLSQWHNFNHYEEIPFQESLSQLDTVFMKTLYLLVILQSFFLIKKLKVKNAYLISAYFLSSVMGSCLIFAVSTFTEYFVTGLNPFLRYVPVFFLVLQIVIWVYLNTFLFKKLAEKISER